MYGYIYETINLVNGIKYIGQRKFGRKEPYFGSSIALIHDIKKYGLDNFKKEILCECETKEDANKMEIYYIAERGAVNSPEYYNIAAGGNQVMAGRKHTKDSKKKQSEAKKGKHPTEETRKKQSEAKRGKNHPMYGKHLSEEIKLKQSVAHKGKIPWNKGKCPSEETRKKLSDANEGKKASEKTKKKMSISRHLYLLRIKNL